MDESQRKKAEREIAGRKEKISKGMENIKHKIVVMSGKGGVGKSTVAANLAFAFRQRGLKVGLLDCDIHGPSIPMIVGTKYNERPTSMGNEISPIATDSGVRVMSMGHLLPERDSPVIWRGPLKMKAIEQFLSDVNWGNLDHLICDLPPGTGDEPLSIAQLLPDADGTVIVTTPQEVAILTIRRAVKFVREMNLRVLGLIENMSGFLCPYCGKKVEVFGSGGGKKLHSDLNVLFLGEIPLDPKIAEGGDAGEPFAIRESPASKAFNDIVNRLENSLL